MLPSKEIFEGVALKKCVAATYNNTNFKLAPHILYTRHDEMYVDAVPLEKDGQPPADLGKVNLHFERSDIFEPAAEKYDGTTLLAVEG